MKWIEAYRIYKLHYAEAAFTGEGARKYGGRWNFEGIAVIYTASSLALAQLETLVHLNGVLPPGGFEYRTIRFPARLVGKTITLQDLERQFFDWRSHPPHDLLREIGSEWVISHQSLAMQVPSVVSPTDANYLINPLHPDFARSVLGKPTSLKLDPRLLGRLPE